MSKLLEASRSQAPATRLGTLRSVQQQPPNGICSHRGLWTGSHGHAWHLSLPKRCGPPNTEIVLAVCPPLGCSAAGQAHDYQCLEQAWSLSTTAVSVFSSLATWPRRWQLPVPNSPLSWQAVMQCSRTLAGKSHNFRGGEREHFRSSEPNWLPPQRSIDLRCTLEGKLGRCLVCGCMCCSCIAGATAMRCCCS